MMKRREFMSLLGCAAAVWPLAAQAQRGKLARIGALVLTSADAQSLGQELREGLRELGYAEGQNYVLEFRSADGNTDRLPGLATDLVRQPVDIIVATFTPCALAAKQATTTIPTLWQLLPIRSAPGSCRAWRPGREHHRLLHMAAETAGKSVELLRNMLPQLRRVAVLANPVDAFTRRFWSRSISQVGRPESKSRPSDGPGA